MPKEICHFWLMQNCSILLLGYITMKVKVGRFISHIRANEYFIVRMFLEIRRTIDLSFCLYILMRRFPLRISKSRFTFYSNDFKKWKMYLFFHTPNATQNNCQAAGVCFFLLWDLHAAQPLNLLPLWIVPWKIYLLQAKQVSLTHQPMEVYCTYFYSTEELVKQISIPKIKMT